MYGSTVTLGTKSGVLFSSLGFPGLGESDRPLHRCPDPDSKCPYKMGRPWRTSRHPRNPRRGLRVWVCKPWRKRHTIIGLNTRTKCASLSSGNTHSRKLRSRLSRVKDLILAAAKPLIARAHRRGQQTTFASCTDSSRIRRRICLRYAGHVRTAPVGIRTSTPWRDGCLDGRERGCSTGWPARRAAAAGGARACISALRRDGEY